MEYWPNLSQLISGRVGFKPKVCSFNIHIYTSMILLELFLML